MLDSTLAARLLLNKLEVVMSGYLVLVLGLRVLELVLELLRDKVELLRDIVVELEVLLVMTGGLDQQRRVTTRETRVRRRRTNRDQLKSLFRMRTFHWFRVHMVVSRETSVVWSLLLQLQTIMELEQL